MFLVYTDIVTIINVSDAKAQLTSLVQRAEAGERIFIARRNTPVVELKVVAPEPARPRPQFGLCAGEFRVPDGFDDPLPDDMLNLFEG